MDLTAGPASRSERTGGFDLSIRIACARNKTTTKIKAAILAPFGTLLISYPLGGIREIRTANIIPMLV
jgi:hypothetical protein